MYEYLKILNPDCIAVWLQKSLYNIQVNQLLLERFLLLSHSCKTIDYQVTYNKDISVTFPPQFVAKASSNPVFELLVVLVVVVVVPNGSPENGSNDALVGVGKLLLPVCVCASQLTTH